MDNQILSPGNPMIIRSEELNGKDEYFGIGYEIFNEMKTYRKNNAQYDKSTRSVDNYDQLLRKSISVAIALKSLKLPDDAIIAFLANNHSDTSVVIVGSHLLGFRVNAYDCLLGHSDFASLLKQIPPSIMFIDEQFVEKMEVAMRLSGVQVQLIVFGHSKEHKVFKDFGIEEGIDSFKPGKLSGQETALIMFTSGTTGLPKGICISHNSLLKQSFCLISMLNLTEDSVFLHFSGYNWITSHIILYACILSGASRVISPLTSAWDAINEHKVTHIYAPPHLVFLLLRQDKPKTEENYSSVKCFITSGSRLNNVLSSEVRNAFTEVNLSQSYGQTEATGWITMFQWHKKEEALLADENPDSVGRLLPGFSCKIVDVESQEILGPNQIGEIRLKSKSFFMKGFYKKDSKDIFDETGWLKTGDLGYFNEDRCFFIVGRCKELIKYREFHIHPQKLEKILESHPAVEKAVVIGIAHPIDGEHAKGIVVLKKGKENALAEDIKSFVDDQVEERLKLWGGVQIVEHIPMTSTGKYKRNELKKKLEN